MYEIDELEGKVTKKNEATETAKHIE